MNRYKTTRELWLKAMDKVYYRYSYNKADYDTAMTLYKQYKEELAMKPIILATDVAPLLLELIDQLGYRVVEDKQVVSEKHGSGVSVNREQRKLVLVKK